MANYRGQWAALCLISASLAPLSSWGLPLSDGANNSISALAQEKSAPRAPVALQTGVPPPAKAKDVPQPPENLESLPKKDAISVLGKKVLGPAAEDMGRVVDLLLDPQARLRAVVIDFGGFLGVGSRKIAIDWRLVRFVPDNPDAPIALTLGKTQIQAAPEYKAQSDQSAVMVGPPPSEPHAAR
jgi:PRC-barrel domain